MSGTEDLTPQQKIINETLEMFAATFPPATRQNFNDSMSTAEIYNIINSHIPDLLPVAELPVLLRQMGYTSTYNPETQSFTWLLA